MCRSSSLCYVQGNYWFSMRMEHLKPCSCSLSLPKRQVASTTMRQSTLLERYVPLLLFGTFLYDSHFFFSVRVCG